jgi:hypothetical protein
VRLVVKGLRVTICLSSIQSVRYDLSCMRIRPALASLALSSLLALFVSCGGGGGGGESGVAEISLEVTPNEIDSGDRMNVRVDLSNVQVPGVAVKFRVPTELRYIRGTAFLQTGDLLVALTPDFNVAESSGTPTATAAAGAAANRASTPRPTATPDTRPKRFVVFFLSRAALIRPGQSSYDGSTATITLQLEGVSDTTGFVGVDVDIDNPNEENDEEFSVSNPQFSPQEEFPIRVE